VRGILPHVRQVLSMLLSFCKFEPPVTGWT